MTKKVAREGKSTNASGRPDWETWRLIPEPELWKAIALSCDIHPGRIEPETGEVSSPDDHPGLSEVSEDETLEFRKRCHIASENLDKHGGIRSRRSPAHRSTHSDPWFSTARLVDVATWVVVRTQWDVPEEFKRLAIDESPSVPAVLAKTTPARLAGGVAVQLPHTTTMLEALFKVMREQWTDYKQRGAPKSSTVALEIDKVMGWKSSKDGKPSRNGDTIASIIRPDNVKEGDDPNLKRRRRG